MADFKGFHLTARAIIWPGLVSATFARNQQGMPQPGCSLYCDLLTDELVSHHQAPELNSSPLFRKG